MARNHEFIAAAIDNAAEALADYASDGADARDALEAAEEFLACAADAILEDMEVI